MTRKDYVLLAQAICRTKFDTTDRCTKYDILDTLVDNVASALREDNPRFDAECFRKACGVEEHAH